jgi:hypothetical protein
VTFTPPFLLAYQRVGSDGYLHAVANAHETQWAVQDPTADLAADVCPDEPDWELSTQVWARLPMAPDAAADGEADFRHVSTWAISDSEKFVCAATPLASSLARRGEP